MSTLAEGVTAEDEQSSAVEYTAQAASPIVSGEVKMTIGDNALSAVSLFDAIEITYAEINALELADYVVTVRADSGDYTFSRMGSWCQPFYDSLLEAYNKAVLRSMFIRGNPELTASGDYYYSEYGNDGGGKAPICVFDNNVTALPPDLSARRVPLCFLSGIEKGEFTLTLTLDAGERYTYSKLGYETDVFADAVEKQTRKLREKTLAAVKEIDVSLTSAQASQLARLMPQGAAASFGAIAGVAPSFAAALESKIAATRAAESHTVFKELCHPANIWVGFRKNENYNINMEQSDDAEADPEQSDDAAIAPEQSDDVPTDPYLLWLIAPSPDGLYAAVEFAEANSATFVYRTGGDFNVFARQINRALEAINFKREVIRLSDEELQKPENSDYYMAAKRNAALQFVRSNFAGRIIHSGADNWKRKLLEAWSDRVQ